MSASIVGKYLDYKLVMLPKQTDPKCNQMAMFKGKDLLGYVGQHGDGKTDIIMKEDKKNHVFPMQIEDFVTEMVINLDDEQEREAQALRDQMRRRI